MDTDYNNMTIIELRARGLRGFTGLRKAGLISFLWNNAMPARQVRPSNMHYDALRMLELTALTREYGLQGYSKLRQAGLIALLWENEPMPTPLVSINPRPRSAARPLRPTRFPPPPPKDLFAPYQLE